MAAAAPGFDPLIAEAKQRMRRRRVLVTLLVLVAGAGVLFPILRPSGAPGTARVTSQPAGNALAHIYVPLEWRQRGPLVNFVTVQPAGMSIGPRFVRQLKRRVASGEDKTGVTVTQFKVWRKAEAVEMVVAYGATRTESSRRRLQRFATFLADPLDGYPWLRVVDRTGANDRVHHGVVPSPKRFQECSRGRRALPTRVLWDDPPPCPKK